MQTTSEIGMDKIDKKSIDGLKADGEKLYTENKEALEKMLAEIIDEKYASKTQQLVKDDQAVSAQVWL